MQKKENENQGGAVVTEDGDDGGTAASARPAAPARAATAPAQHRPRLRYTEELGERICQRLATSTNLLRHICHDMGIGDVSTIWDWRRAHPAFAAAYARARVAQQEVCADELIEIARGIDVSNPVSAVQAKLKIDALKWLMAKRAPRQFGDQLPEAAIPGQQLVPRIVITRTITVVETK